MLYPPLHFCPQLDSTHFHSSFSFFLSSCVYRWQSQIFERWSRLRQWQVPRGDHRSSQARFTYNCRLLYGVHFGPCAHLWEHCNLAVIMNFQFRKRERERGWWYICWLLLSMQHAPWTVYCLRSFSFLRPSVRSWSIHSISLVASTKVFFVTASEPSVFVTPPPLGWKEAQSDLANFPRREEEYSPFARSFYA